MPPSHRASWPSTGTRRSTVATSAVEGGERRRPAGRAAAPRPRRRRTCGALNDEVESPLIGVLARMEVVGIRVDTDELRRVSKELVADCAALETEIHELAGHPFNVNSTPQLRTVLYDEIGLKPGPPDQDRVLDRRRHARGPPRPAPDRRGAAALPGGREAPVHLRRDAARRGEGRRPHPRVVPTDGGPDRPAVLGATQPAQHPGALRLGQAVPPGVRPGGGVRASWWPTTTRSSCGSSPTWPPTQGCSKRSPSGTDIHRVVASGVFGVPVEEVTRTQREYSKMVSYGLAYGMEAYGLARRLVHRGRGGRRDHGPVLRGLPGGAGLHGRHGGRGPAPRLHPDRLRAHPAPARAGRPQLPGPPGGRASGDERGHPGTGRRPVQDGARPGRPRASGGRAPRAGWFYRSTTR